MTTTSEPTRYAVHILAGLQRKTMYEGTVPFKEIARRRKVGKAARIARRNNR